MKIYELAGVSAEGKQIIKRQGSRWEFIESVDSVKFSDKRGPWLRLEPLGAQRIALNVIEARQEVFAMWVHAFYDKDFKVMP